MHYSRLAKSLKTLLIILAVTMAPFIHTSPVTSLDNCNEKLLRDLGIIILDCDGESFDCSTGTAVKLIGDDNQEKAFRYFIDPARGLTPEQSAGIVGNIIRESLADPTRIQGGDTSNTSINPRDAGSLGWGLIQWTPGERVLGYAEQAGLDPGRVHELDVQLEIIWWHLNNTTPTGRRNVLPGMKATQTVEEATAYFEEYVEGAGVVALDSRISFAREVLDLYGGTADVSLAASSQDPCRLRSNSNFTVYSQYDERWRNEPYGTSTIGKSGCGPSAVAMALTAITGTTITPVDTAIVGAANGTYIAGRGSASTLTPILAEHYGVQSEPIATDIGEITAALKAGKMVITSGAGAKPFTSGGHIIVIRGLTSDGDFLIGDSGHSDTSDRAWSPQELLPQMQQRSGSAHTIY